MNSIPEALRAAGVKLPPVKKRIWLWLQDHPRKTAHGVSAALQISISRARNELLKLKQQGRVEARRDPMRRIGHPVLEYTAVGQSYECPPRVSAAQSPKIVRPGKSQCGPVVDATPRPISIADMPLAKAFVLYQELKGYFAS